MGQRTCSKEPLRTAGAVSRGSPDNSAAAPNSQPRICGTDCRRALLHRDPRCPECAGDARQNRVLVKLVPGHRRRQVDDGREHATVVVSGRIHGDARTNVGRTRVGSICPGECIVVEDKRRIVNLLPHSLTHVAISRIADAGSLKLGSIRVPGGGAKVDESSIGHRIRVSRGALRYHFELPQTDNRRPVRDPDEGGRSGVQQVRH